jgi:hypothetical protein
VARAATVPAREFGARGDGHVDDAAALHRAFNSGSIVDGQNQTYAVAGNVECGAQFRGLANARLIQLRPGGDDHRRTVQIQGATNFTIENVQFDRGGNGSEITQKAFASTAGGVFLVRCTNFQLHDVQAFGGGIGSGLAFIDCSHFTLTNLQVHNLWYRLQKHPDDDAIQGMFFARCSDFTLQGSGASDIGGTDGVTNTNHNNRGIAITGCSDFRLIGPQVTRVGQGIDISGSLGNRNFSVTQGVATNCHSWGFKFANSAIDGDVSGTVARRCGLGGFVVSGPHSAGTPKSQSIKISDCQAEDVLGTMAGGSFGFGILGKNASDPTYPRDVLFLRCAARTQPSVGRMEYGFWNEIPARLTGNRPNRAVDCIATGWRRAAVSGFE